MTAYIRNVYVKVISVLLIGLVGSFAYANQTTATKPNENLDLVTLIPSPSIHSRQLHLFGKSLNIGTFVLQIGGFTASQGKAQNINIIGLDGDYFTLTHRSSSNVLLGLGDYFQGLTHNQLNLLYGINAFFLPHTLVQGNVVQEQLFTNLSYHYSVTNYPLYIATKMLIRTNEGKNDITFDFGLGPNFIKANDFSERSLDGGVTLPDNIFSGNTSVAFSLTMGAGIKFNNILGLPGELSYRFFYLGQGCLSKSNSQVVNTLKTGNSFANALIFSVYA